MNDIFVLRADGDELAILKYVTCQKTFILKIFEAFQIPPGSSFNIKFFPMKKWPLFVLERKTGWWVGVKNDERQKWVEIKKNCSRYKHMSYFYRNLREYFPYREGFHFSQPENTQYRSIKRGKHISRY